MISEHADRIIDSHVHMGIYGPYEIGLEDLTKEMDRSGVDQAEKVFYKNARKLFWKE